MRLLVQGCESEERLDIMISLTSIRSPEKIKAIKAHLLVGEGADLATAAWLSGVDLANVKKTLAELNVVAAKLERLKELDWPGYTA